MAVVTIYTDVEHFGAAEINPAGVRPLQVSTIDNGSHWANNRGKASRSASVLGPGPTYSSKRDSNCMIRQLPLIFVATVILLAAGCAETPTEAGTSMARKHLESGTDPSPQAKAQMQAEVNERVTGYDIREMQEFMQAYLTTIMEESPTMMQLQGRAMEELGRAMQHQANRPR